MHLQSVLYARDLDLQQGKHICNALYSSGDEERSYSNPIKKCSVERNEVPACRVSKLSCSYKKHKKSKTAGHGNIGKSEIYDMSMLARNNYKLESVSDDVPVSLIKNQKTDAQVQGPGFQEVNKWKTESSDKSGQHSKKSKTSHQFHSSSSTNETIPTEVVCYGNEDFVVRNIADQSRDEFRNVSAKRHLVETGLDHYHVNDCTWLPMAEATSTNDLASTPLHPGQLLLTNFYQRAQKKRAVRNQYCSQSRKGKDESGNNIKSCVRGPSRNMMNEETCGRVSEIKLSIAKRDNCLDVTLNKVFQSRSVGDHYNGSAKDGSVVEVLGSKASDDTSDDDGSDDDGSDDDGSDDDGSDDDGSDDDGSDDDGFDDDGSNDDGSDDDGSEDDGSIDCTEMTSSHENNGMVNNVGDYLVDSDDDPKENPNAAHWKRLVKRCVYQININKEVCTNLIVDLCYFPFFIVAASPTVIPKMYQLRGR